MKKKVLGTLLIGFVMTAMVACGGNATADSAKEPVANTSQKEESQREPAKEESQAEVSDVIQATADANGNYVYNGGFEEDDLKGWVLVNNNVDELNLYDRDTDCHDGVRSLHYYSTKDFDFTAEQKLTGLEAGKYKFSGFIQGDTAGDANAEIKFYVVTKDGRMDAAGMVNGYLSWNEAVVDGIEISDGEVTIGVSVKNAANGWGTIDSISLTKE